MRTPKFVFLLAPLFLLALGMPGSLHAQSGTVTPTQTNGGNIGVPTQTNGGNTCSGSGLCNPLSSQGDLPTFLKNILGFVVKIGTIVVVLMLVFVGFKFVTARGEPGELTKAKTMLLWTLIGGLVLLGAQAISAGIQATVTGLGG